MSETSPLAVVTGAGTGVGRAVTLKLAQEGWRVAMIGRRAETLAETRTLVGSQGPEVAAFPCDIGDADAVDAVIKEVLARFGRVDALINAAGTNIPKRSLEVLTHADYHAAIATNLHGAFYCVQAVLPTMRTQKAGTIVNINSEAGLKASAKAGAAYVVSKFGLAGLTQTINAEERANGIRATSIFPGDINTPLLDKRPQPPPPEARVGMLQPADLAACVWLAVSLPPRAIVEELVVRPR